MPATSREPYSLYKSTSECGKSKQITPRRSISFTRKYSNLLKKWYRMHKAKEKFHAMIIEAISKKQQLFYNYHAIFLQKIWRGFFSRNHVYDFYARSRYLKKIEEKNEIVKRQMEEYMKSSILDEQKRKEEAARAEFNEICKRVHHLASTSAVPGIYNSPYPMAGIKPQVFNADIETHLKMSFKSTYQWKSPSKDKIEKYKRYIGNKAYRRKCLSKRSVYL